MRVVLRQNLVCGSPLGLFVAKYGMCDNTLGFLGN